MYRSVDRGVRLVSGNSENYLAIICHMKIYYDIYDISVLFYGMIINVQMAIAVAVFLHLNFCGISHRNRI